MENTTNEPFGQMLNARAPWQSSSGEDEPTDSPSETALRGMPTASPATREERMLRRQSTSHHQVDYHAPDVFANLNEASGIEPVPTRDGDLLYRHRSLEQARSYSLSQASRIASQHTEVVAEETVDAEESAGGPGIVNVSRLATHFYTISYLILFSLFGTLARLGLQALTTYPGSPVNLTSLWPNFAGSLVMGFLAEDRMLFRFEGATPAYELETQGANARVQDEESSSSDRNCANLAAAENTYKATKKTTPLYIGMATGFCGSFTSFSAFARDTFLALSNDLTPTESRHDGYSFMALVAVILTTVSLSLSGLFIGAHLAIALEPYTPSLPYLFTRKVIDRAAVLLGWGCWLGAVLLSILPPDRGDSGQDTWRGQVTFALVFAPLGCLARFYASLYLNGTIASFPLGTFAVNVTGTAILGMAWDLAHHPLGGVIGCQVLQGVEDGLCGCLTTVSTWVAELSGLKRRNAYVYGATSVLTALVLLVAIMGGLRWSHGFADLACTH